jgi:hypothetical protein
MRKLLTFLIALAGIALVSVPAPAHAFGCNGWQIMGAGGNGCNSSIGGAYTGPGDVATWKVFWSLRAYSAATRGNRLANVCNSTGGVDVGCADMLSDATTGNLVSATISGIPCPGANCTVKTLYDISGQNFCTNGTAPCDVTQATVSKRPTLTANCINTSLPCMTFVSTGPQFLAATAFSPAGGTQPVSSTWISNFTNPGGGGTFSVGSQSSSNTMWFSNHNTNGFFINAGATLGDVTSTDGAWHSYQGLFTTSPNSVISVDNTETTGNAGTGAIANDLFAIGAASSSPSFPFNGKIVEMGFDTTLHNGTSRTAMCHNQFTYWGTSTSC